MDIISYCHNLDDRILVRLKTREKSAVNILDIEQWLQVIDGILAIQPNAHNNELSITFDKNRIDAFSLLHLLGYSGPFIKH